MLDMKLIRSEPDRVKELLHRRQMDCDALVDELLEVDEQRRKEGSRVDGMKAQQNAASKEIPAVKKAGGDVAPIMARMKALSDEIKACDQVLSDLEQRQQTLLLSLPNLPDEDVVAGGKEQNQVLRTFGEKPVFSFEPKNHVDLCEQNGLIDYQRGAKLAGNGAWLYRGMGARMEWALLNYFISEHLKDGYELILPPHMLGYECGKVAGQFPKFADEVYWIENPTSSERKFMLPTAETALVNLHRDEILSPKDLPRKYIAYTPCYRREAGSYRSEERGMIRGHQFNKVEMVQYTAPDQSDAAFDELVQKAERLMQGLGLHYRVSKLAAGDCSASMARTFDIEVWIPSMGIYKEVSSASNAREYQARRGNIKMRGEDKKLQFVHTLNASGLATSRVLPAIVEQYQNADGSITVPPVLVPFLGCERIGG